MGFLSSLGSGGLISGVTGFLGASAAKKQSKKIIRDYDSAQAGALEGRDASLGYFEPFREGGGNAFARAGQMQSGGFQYSPSDPSYAFRLSQGQEAIDRSAAAGGTLNSGGTLKALARYGQGLASTEFQNDFARNAQLANFGLQGAQGSANAQNNYTNALFNATQGRAGAREMRAGAIADQFTAGGNIASSVISAAFPGGGGFGGF
jgi:hypothetical protein